MTTAKFIKKNGNHTVRISGHADYSHPDIVCAAVSMLTCTLAAALNKRKGFFANIKKGKAYIKVPCSNAADAAVDTVKTGMFLLAEHYPKNVVLKEEGYAENN